MQISSPGLDLRGPFLKKLLIVIRKLYLFIRGSTTIYKDNRNYKSCSFVSILGNAF